MDVVRLQYGYDRAGNRLYRRDYLALANSASFDELYDYDGLDRLTSFDRGELNSANTGLTGGPTLTQDWTLDGTGNWSGFSQTVQSALTQTRTHNPVNEITGISETVGTAWPDPSYDANGNTTSFPKPASLGDGMTATYDAWNRLVKVADSGGTVAEYQYDGLDRRTEKIAGGTTLHDYFSDQWQTLEERTGSSASADRQFVWGQRYLDDLILRDRASERLYALQDALFNVVALASNTGVVQERFAYQPYGQSDPLDPDFTPYSGTDFNWEYRFTGRELDLESELQMNRNRYLHLQLGRWVTRDPVGYLSGPNLYSAQSTTTKVDPHGNIAISVDRFQSLDSGECDELRERTIRWRFGFNKPAPSCPGYFVQKVTVMCTVAPCGKYANFTQVYWEYWPVQNPQTGFVRDLVSYTPGDGDLHGSYSQDGEVRYYCATDAINKELATWKPYSRIEGNCLASSGTLPATSEPPKFWANDPKDGKPERGPAERMFEYGITCCGECDENGIDADANPRKE
ncbi:MAG: hypothetical protein JNL18_06070 [Planctomycetaceae bacterium]|jgi:RHS repeat-associated protein|nr:hypothetical protein [Planctomycetaceae bacterium]